MRTIAYDVIGVYVFLLTLMRFLLKKEVNFIPPRLLRFPGNSHSGVKKKRPLFKKEVYFKETNCAL